MPEVEEVNTTNNGINMNDGVGSMMEGISLDQPSANVLIEMTQLRLQLLQLWIATNGCGPCELLLQLVKLRPRM